MVPLCHMELPRQPQQTSTHFGRTVESGWRHRGKAGRGHPESCGFRLRDSVSQVRHQELSHDFLLDSLTLFGIEWGVLPSNYVDTMIFCLIHWCCLEFRRNFNHQTMWIPWYSAWFIGVVWDLMEVWTIKLWGYHDILVDLLMLFVVSFGFNHQTMGIQWYSAWFIDVVWDLSGILTIKLCGYRDILVDSLMLFGFNGGFNHRTVGIPWFSGRFLDVSCFGFHGGFLQSNYGDTTLFRLIHWCCLRFNGGFNHQTMGIPRFSGWFIDVVWGYMVVLTIKQGGYHDILVDSLMLFGIQWRF